MGAVSRGGGIGPLAYLDGGTCIQHRLQDTETMVAGLHWSFLPRAMSAAGSNGHATRDSPSNATKMCSPERSCASRADQCKGSTCNTGAALTVDVLQLVLQACGQRHNVLSQRIATLLHSNSILLG